MFYVYYWSLENDLVTAYGTKEGTGQPHAVVQPLSSFILLRGERGTLHPTLTAGTLPYPVIHETTGEKIPENHLHVLQNETERRGIISASALTEIARSPEKWQYEASYLGDYDSLHKHFIRRDIPQYCGWFNETDLTFVREATNQVLPTFTVLTYDIECATGEGNGFPYELNARDRVYSVACVKARIRGEKESTVLEKRVFLVTEGNPEMATVGDPKMVTVGDPKMVTVGDPKMVTVGDPKMVTVGDPKMVTVGDPKMVKGNPKMVKGNPKMVEGNPEITEFNLEMMTADNSEMTERNLKLTESDQEKTTVSNPEMTADNKPIVQCFTHEKAMLKALIEYFSCRDVQFLLAFNNSNFDDKFLAGRYFHYGLEKEVYRFDYSVSDDRPVVLRYAPGQLNLDVYKFVKAHYKFPRYSLDYLTKQVLPPEETKLPMDYVQMNNIFRNIRTAKRREIDNIVEYNLQDSMVTFLLFRRFKVLSFLLTISSQCYISAERLVLGGTTELLKGFICIFGYRNGYILRCKHFRKEEEEQQKKYEGAVVYLAKKGIYEGVVVLDFLSLYPSIIRAFNISPSTCREVVIKDYTKEDTNNIETDVTETLAEENEDKTCIEETEVEPYAEKTEVEPYAEETEVEPCSEKTEVETYAKEREVKTCAKEREVKTCVNETENENCASELLMKNTKIINTAVESSEVTNKQQQKLPINSISLEPNRYSVTQTSEEKVGLFPLICSTLLQTREEIKTKLKNEKLSENEEKHYQSLQMTVKIIANSCYGQMGSIFSPFYHRIAAETVTARARQLILKSKRFVEENGFTTNYLDTDSLFFKATEEEGRKMAAKITEHLNIPGLVMQYENYFTKLFLFSKKKYYGILKGGAGFKVSGMELNRRDFPTHCKNILSRIMGNIFSEELTSCIDYAKDLFDFNLSFQYELFSKYMNVKPIYMYKPNCHAPHVNYLRRTETRLTSRTQAPFVTLQLTYVTKQKVQGFNLSMADHIEPRYRGVLPVDLFESTKSACVLFDNIYAIATDNQKFDHFQRIREVLQKYSLVVCELKAIFAGCVLTFENKIMLNIPDVVIKKKKNKRHYPSIEHYFNQTVPKKIKI